MKTTLSIEQPARLIELGVDPKLASDSEIYDEPFHRSYMAVYTLSDLLRILPKKITAKRSTYILEIGVCTNPDNWYAKYRHERTNSTLYDLWAIKGELIEVIYEILLKIKGKKYKIQEL